MTYDELDPKATERANGTLRRWAADDIDLDPTTEDFEEILRLMGYANVATEYSGFCSQGDGANFTGTWYARRFDYTGVMEHAPEDTALHALALRVLGLTLTYDDCIFRVAQHSGRCIHSRAMFIAEASHDTACEIEAQAISRALADWYYDVLETEWEYQQSDEALAAMADGMTFDITGEPQ